MGSSCPCEVCLQSSMGVVSLVSLGTHHQIIHHKFTFANLCSVAKDKKFQSQFISLLTTNISYKMRCFAVLFSVLLFIISTMGSPLQGGYGGVYNSPEANAYWARRFGGIFGDNLRGLAAVQANIDNQALANRGLIP